MTSIPPTPPPDRSGVFMAYVAMVGSLLWMLLCGVCTAFVIPVGGGDPNFFITVGAVCGAPGIIVFALSLRHVMRH